MKILITGAGGFIGSALLPLLARREDNEVTALIRPASAAGLMQRHEAQQTPCRYLVAEPQDWARTIQGFQFDACVHLAWVATPGIYLNSPENTLCEAATLDLATQLFAGGLSHFIGAGTCIEYAPGPTEPCTEDYTPEGPVSPYAQANLRSQKDLTSLAEAHQSGWTWARIFYPYGTGEHRGRTATSFLRSLKARQPLVLKTGASQKDFIEITDLASALAHLSRGLPQGVINLGTGIPTSIRDLALSAARLTGASPGLVQDAEPPGADPYAYHVACTAKLSATGWRPSVGLTEGMSRLLASLHDS